MSAFCLFERRSDTKLSFSVEIVENFYGPTPPANSFAATMTLLENYFKRVPNSKLRITKLIPSFVIVEAIFF